MNCTVAEFIRLRSVPLDDKEGANTRKFICELPAATDDEKWLECGEVVASAAGGLIRRVEVLLNETFQQEVGDSSYEPEEVLGVVLLWLEWESWLPMSRVRVSLSDGKRTYEGTYLADTSRFVRRTPRI